MNKVLACILLLFFISGSFVTTFSSVFCSELVEDSWNTKTSMNYERSQGGVVVLDGKIYVIGGYNNGGYERANECYDPATDQWVTLEPMPTPRSNFAMTVYQGKIFCIGGQTYIYNSPVIARSLDIVEVYDPVTDSWSSKGSFPNEYAYQAHIVNGQFFVITHLGALYMYNSVTDVWINKTEIPLQGRMAFSVAVGNKIIVGDHLSEYTMGGGTPFSDQLGIRIYDPRTNKWSEGKTSPELTIFVLYASAGVTTGIYAPENVYVFGLAFAGGYNTGTGQPFTWVYNPIHNSWSTAKPGDYTGRVAVVDDILYIIGSTFNAQYVPTGYYDTQISTTSPSASDVISSPVPSELTPFRSFSTGFVVVIIVLTTSIAVLASLFFYVRQKRKDGK